MEYFLAIDIGASSGRHVLGHFEEGKLQIEEVYRFKNHVVNSKGHLIWDLENLEREIIRGMKKCKEINKIPTSVGIDTFGVDYVLLDENDALIGDVYSYRDTRTNYAKKEFEKIIDEKEIYKITGIQPQVFNSVYQLYDDYLTGRSKNVNDIMFLPSYLTYYLTGKKSNELSISSTSGILNKNHTEFSPEILKLLRLKNIDFSPLMKSGSYLGNLKDSIVSKVGYDTKVVLALEHDTASAVYGAEVSEDEVFISSGTWSLLGVVQDKTINTEEAFESGFTNEVTSLTQIRFLKNIMGMWLISEIEREQEERIPIVEIVKMAEKGSAYQEVFDVTSSEFLSPASMTNAINDNYLQRGITPPKNLEELFYSVFNSLATYYASSVKELEKITNKTYKRIKIFGGGSQNLLLNRLTSEKSGKEVVRGPVEATAIGNILSQQLNER